jgi:hypothetical protein
MIAKLGLGELFERPPPQKAGSLISRRKQAHREFDEAGASFQGS